MASDRVDQVLHIALHNEAATERLAQQLASVIVPPEHPAAEHTGARIHLRGDLGAGKTSFVRAFLRACGVSGRIKSPSYALLESYNVSSLYFYHLDFYRFSDTLDWIDAGFREILHENNVILIEWPERAGEHLPAPDLDLHLEYAGSGRQATLTAYSNKGRLWLTTLDMLQRP